jgi:esterase/lipase
MVEGDLQIYEKVLITEYLASKEQAVILCHNHSGSAHQRRLMTQYLGELNATMLFPHVSMDGYGTDDLSSQM